MYPNPITYTEESHPNLSDAPETGSFIGRSLSIIYDIGTMIYKIFEVVIEELVSYLLDNWTDSSRKHDNHYFIFNLPTNDASKNLKINNTEKYYCGIPNPKGLDCFMNAVLQCFYNIFSVIDKEKIPTSEKFSEKIEINHLKKMIQEFEHALEINHRDQVSEKLKLMDQTIQKIKIQVERQPIVDEIQTIFIEMFNLLQEVNQLSCPPSTVSKQIFSTLNGQMRGLLPKMNQNIKKDAFNDAHEYFELILETLLFKTSSYICEHRLRYNESLVTYVSKEEHSSLIARFPRNPSSPLHLSTMLLNNDEIRGEFILEKGATQLNNHLTIPDNTLDHQTLKIAKNQLPPLFLSIQLARFSENKKIFNEVAFDPILDIEISKIDPTDQEVNIFLQENIDGSIQKEGIIHEATFIARYRLNSVVLHYGPSLESYHYIAYCLDESGNYILYDDDKKVGQCEDKKAVESDIRNCGYLFFYVFDKLVSLNELQKPDHESVT